MKINWWVCLIHFSAFQSPLKISRMTLKKKGTYGLWWSISSPEEATGSYLSSFVLLQSCALSFYIPPAGNLTSNDKQPASACGVAAALWTRCKWNRSASRRKKLTRKSHRRPRNSRLDPADGCQVSVSTHAGQLNAFKRFNVHENNAGGAWINKHMLTRKVYSCVSPLECSLNLL